MMTQIALIWPPGAKPEHIGRRLWPSRVSGTIGEPATSGHGLTGLVIATAGNSGQVYSDLIRTARRSARAVAARPPHSRNEGLALLVAGRHARCSDHRRPGGHHQPRLSRANGSCRADRTHTSRRAAAGEPYGRGRSVRARAAHPPGLTCEHACPAARRGGKPAGCLAHWPVTSASACATLIGTLTGTDSAGASTPPAPPEPVQVTCHITLTDAW
jgi:hypothetical protein